MLDTGVGSHVVHFWQRMILALGPVEIIHDQDWCETGIRPRLFEFILLLECRQALFAVFVESTGTAVTCGKQGRKVFFCILGDIDSLLSGFGIEPAKGQDETAIYSFFPA